MAEEILQQAYDDSSIVTLEGAEHIRRRPGMYIGRLGDGRNPSDGIYVLLKEIIDNSIDEYAMGFGKVIKVRLEDNEVSVRDFGRGIPLDSVVKVVSILNTGGKFDDKVFKKSVGLNGVGTKAVNALSERFYVCSYRDGESSWARFERGRLVEQGREASGEKNGTLVVFSPDPKMFIGFNYNVETVETMMRNYSYLKRGLSLDFNGTVYKSENGLLDLVNETISETPLYPPIHLEGEDIEVVLTHGNAYGENIASFVNGQNTREGGTHLAAFREAVAKTIKDFFKKNYLPEDCRQGIVGAVSIQIQEPTFEAQTKTKLGSLYVWDKQDSGEHGPTIRTFVNDFVSKALNDYLTIHKEIVPILEEKIKSSQKEREEIAGIQKKTRERSKRTSVYNSKLRDCRYHLCDKRTEKTEEFIEKSSIFITEGDSASGTITKARDANFQAVFSLRGKPINCFKESHKKVAENEELNLLINALGVEDDLENLRYNQIVVATDADDDGMHIRMLVVTFFMKYYPDLIRRGHVHILQTPLFRVRNRKDTAYCYSPEEKEKSVEKMGKDAEITRFKGLGEISYSEFKDFIGDGMRLDPVSLADEESISDIMTFYMGDNTPERQRFIRLNLRSEKEMEDVDL
ncbi:MAG: type IIA DNA topoisomerase subunit B [Bacteroidales bacterium]|nr:type IIA DNA topoisomerase subunit B [Bacteroidales bacterium]